MNPKNQIARRRFLRGLGGVMVGLPALDIFYNKAHAQAAPPRIYHALMLQQNGAIQGRGDDPDMFLPIRALLWLGLVGYPPARVDHQFKDGDTIRLGPIALTAHITAGHTRGCTSFSFTVQDGERALNVVSVCDTGVLSLSSYPEQAADRERSIKVLRSLPADIWVTNHARPWGRYRKFVASREAKTPVDAFIDPEGYRLFIDKAEEELRLGLVH